MVRKERHQDEENGINSTDFQPSKLKTLFGHPLISFLALSSAEKKKKPSIESMFDDVYDVRTPELERQYAELLEHLDEYGDKYNLDIYHKS